MNKAIKSIISAILLILVLFMIVLVCFNTHDHICEHTTCTQCELLRSVNDSLSLLLVLISILAVTYYIVSLLAFILTKYSGVELTPIKLRDKLSD